jgi:IPT/TIG domain
VPPPTISLAFLGKLRDKVGATPTAFAPDTALDGTFQMAVQGGVWPRTVTKLDLRRTGGGGNWDTDPVSSFWALGASTGLDSALLNGAGGAVSFAAANGAAFYLFASDLVPTPFSAGSSFTLTANFADGTSASATVTLPVMPTISGVSPSSGAAGASLTVTVTGTNFQPGASASFGPNITVNSTTVVSSTQLSVAITIGSVLGGVRDVTVSNPDGQSVIRAGAFTIVAPPPTLILEFQGKLRDKVGTTPTAFAPDGALDGAFRVVVQGGIWPRTVTRVELRQTSGGGGIWDTDPATTFWALGTTTSLDGALLNAGNGTVSFAVADGGAFYVFAADAPISAFTAGTSFSLTVNLADGTVATVSATIP